MDTIQNEMTPGLSTGKTLISVFSGILVSFIIFILYYSVFFTLDLTYNLLSLKSATLSPGTEILLKFLTAFLACTTTITVLLPIVFRFAYYSNKTQSFKDLKANIVPSLAALLVLVIEYFLFTEYMSGNRHHWVIPVMYLLAILMFFIPWIRFIRSFKSDGYRWIAVVYAVLMICSALFPAIVR